MLAEGQEAPDFQLLGTDGTDIDSYRLSDHTDDGAVVLRFYPGDFSAVCGEKLCEFRDTDWLTLNPDVTVFGISTDTLPAHEAFIGDLKLNFPLLSDNNGAVCKQYEVGVEELAGHRIDGSLHALYVVDEDRRVEYAWSVELPSVPDIEALRQLRAAEADIQIQPDIAAIRAALENVVELPSGAF